MNTDNLCLNGYCKWAKQGDTIFCSHPKAVNLIKLEKPCKVCGRKPNAIEPSCGACIGRGLYIYHTCYEDCDCGGYERKKNIL